MKNHRFWLLILSVVCVTVDVVRADDCVCATMPMYQVPGGWYHAATVFNLPSSAGLPCNVQYTTGIVLNAQYYNQSCKYSPRCGNCTSLGDEATPPNDMSYNCAVPKYDDVKAPGDFQNFLEALHSGDDYSDFTFSNPRVLRLKRPASSGPATDFYALIMTSTYNQTPPRSGIVGIEIQDSGPSSPGPIDVDSECLAVHTGKSNKQKPIKGMLKVEFNGLSERGFVLLNHQNNNNVNYDACRVVVMDNMVPFAVPNQSIAACPQQCCPSQRHVLRRRWRCR
jgi:hypothetical protein